jgi:drug/metabolite transporter superfamily protein YnfA
MSMPVNEQPKDSFARMAEAKRVGIFSDFLAFLKQNKKWWLLPIVILLALVGLLIILGSTAAAPFIYSLF